MDLADVTISGVDRVSVEGLRHFGKLDRGSILRQVLSENEQEDDVSVTIW